MPKFSTDELKSIQHHYHLGCQLVNAGKLEDAIPHFDQVLVKLPPRRRDRPYRIAQTAEMRQRTGGDPLVLPPIFRDALLAKASVLNELGRYDDAYRLLQRAVELDPDNPVIYAELGMTQSWRDNLEQARQAYARALALQPDNPLFLRALSHIAVIQEDYPAASLFAQRALDFEPESLESLHHLAYAEYRQDNIEGAVTALQRAVQLDPADLESALRLAGTLREAGRIREAITCMSGFLQHDVQDPEALGLMTDLLQQDGTAPELLPHAQRLLARNPRDPLALELLAWGHFQHGQEDDALQVLRRLVSVEPMQGYHHFKIGMVYQTMGQIVPAMAAFLRAIALNPESEVGRMALEATASLDQVQLEQLITRAQADAHFRYRLQHNAELTLHQSGYLLSPAGFQLLQSFDLEADVPQSTDPFAKVIH